MQLGIFNLEELRSLIRLELVQMHEEGFQVDEFMEPMRLVDRMSFKELGELYLKLKEAEPKPNYPYVEPTGLKELKHRRPKGPRLLDVDISSKELENRLMAAWLGRCVGCLLGKPVEGLSRELIELYLKKAGEYPLKDYLPPLGKPSKGFPRNLVKFAGDCLRGRISYMPRDDDVDYTIMGLHVLETHGFGFTTLNVGLEWLSHLPYRATYTAERAAYRNLVLGLKPPETATHLNPYREWIGAQIRADIWGYTSPGMLERAADMAYRDAVLSHVKNGVYGEVFVAATLAAALAVDTVEEALRLGLTEIPESSRLSEVVRNVVSWSKLDGEWADTWERVMGAYGRYHGVHVLNNVAMVVLALMHGDGDFTRSIGIAVMCGLDTDCNGATVGSILGALKGLNAIPDRWFKPLKDRVKSLVAGFDNSSIRTLAFRTARLAERSLKQI